MTIQDCVNNLCAALKKYLARLEVLEAKPSYKSSVVNNLDGTYSHTDGDAASTLIDVRPSEVPCNGLRVDTVGKLYVEDLGYRRAKDWDQLKTLLDAGTPAFVCDEITATDAHVFNSGVIWFAPGGSINTAGFAITVNIPYHNPDDHQIWSGFVLDETYPARWTGGGSNLRGTFGGNFSRDPRHWGMTTNTNPTNAPLSEAQANNNAIAAAALSTPTLNEQLPIRVVLPQGYIPIHRTIRLDGLKCALVGSGGEPSSHTGTRIWCDNANYLFDTTHYIETIQFPTGTTPVIEVGYERDTVSNPDEGFQCGVQGLSIVCPVQNIMDDRPVSGIMWEAGMQENAKLSQFVVSNASGYGFGGPEYQTESHNLPSITDLTFPQVNTVVIEEFWINSPHPDYPEFIGGAIFGSNWEVRNGSIIQVRNNGATSADWNLNTRSALIVGSDSVGKVASIHFETSHAVGTPLGAIEVIAPQTVPRSPNPAQVINQGITIDSIFNWYFGNQVPSLESGGVVINNPRAAVFCSNIRHRTNNDWAEFSAIHDVSTGRKSTGNYAANTGGFVALYARQSNNQSGGGYKISTTDPGLELTGSGPYDPNDLADGAGETTTVTVTGALPGMFAEASFSNDLQGILLTAWVSANDTVSVRFQNETGGNINLAAGTLRARVVSH